MYIFIRCLAAFFGLACSYFVGAFSLTGGVPFATVVIAALGVAHLLAICLVVFRVKRGDVGVATAVLLAPAFVVLAAGYLISIVIPLWRAYSPDSARDAACIKTGVEYTSPPAAPVSAVHVDWDAENPFGDLMKSYSVDSGGHLEAIDQGIPAPELLVDSPLADVLITHEVSSRDELQKGFRLRGLIAFTLTATDRRDGRRLGTMKFAVDMVKGHACGANVPNRIDIDAFIHQVIGIPGKLTASAPDVATIDVNLDTMEGEDYSLRDTDDSREIAMRASSADCKAMLPRLGPARRRFASDPTGLRSLPNFALLQMHCDNSGIWALEFLPKQQESIITKYSPEGDLLYKMRVIYPKRVAKDDRFIDSTTMALAGGYLTLVWVNQTPRPDGSPIHGTRFRIKEPKL
jgi:hypothetical protein